MKIKILALAFCACYLQTLAQTEDTSVKSSFTISSGVSKPTGNFSTTDLGSKKSGFAEQGYLIAAEYNAFIDQYFGLGLTFGMRRNAVDIDTYRNQKPLGQYYAHSNWRSNYFLANTVFQYPLAPVLALYFKVGAGASFNTLPDINSRENQKTSYYDLQRTESFAYGLGSGIKWQGKRIGANFEIYSFNTTAKVQINSKELGSELNTINYSFGITYRIN